MNSWNEITRIEYKIIAWCNMCGFRLHRFGISHDLSCQVSSFDACCIMKKWKIDQKKKEKRNENRLENCWIYRVKNHITNRLLRKRFSFVECRVTISNVLPCQVWHNKCAWCAWWYSMLLTRHRGRFPDRLGYRHRPEAWIRWRRRQSASTGWRCTKATRAFATSKAFNSGCLVG